MTRLIDREEQAANVPVPIGGFNTNDAANFIPLVQGTDAWNVEIDEVLGISKRSGFTTYNSATAVIPKYSGGTVKNITGPMIYGSAAAWTGGVVATGDKFRMEGENVFYTLSTVVGANTLSLASPYTGTLTAGGKYGVAPNGVMGMHNYKYGTTQKLVVFAGNDLYAGGTGLLGSFTALSAGLTDNQRTKAITFQDVLYFCNGYEYNTYNGAAVAAVGGTPSPSDPKYLALYTIGNANYIVIGGSNTDADKSRVSFSDVNAGATYPSANKYLVGDRDGTVITGLAQVGSGMAIFKTNSIYLLSGLPSSGTLRKIVDDVGCVAPHTLVEQEGFVYFVGRRGGKLGLFRFDGTSSVIGLSDSIEPTLAALNQTYVGNMCGGIYDNKYFLSGTSTSGTFNDRHFICYIYRPFDGTAGAKYYPWCRGNRGYNFLLNWDSSGVVYLMSGSPTNGFVYREETDDSDDIADNTFGLTSTAIDSYVFSRWFNFGDSSRKKELLRAYLELDRPGNWNLILRLYTDFQTYGYNTYNISLRSNTNTWAEITYLVTPWQQSISKAVTELKFDYPTFARYFRFRWSNSTADEYFTVYPMICYLKNETVR